MADEGGAKARLETAIKRLELAVGQEAERRGTETKDAKLLHRKIESLKSELSNAQAENDRLSHDLAETKAKNVALQSTMNTISTRLDDAIDAVQALLEE